MWMKNVNNFQIAKVQPQVACIAVQMLVGRVTQGERVTNSSPVGRRDKEVLVNIPTRDIKFYYQVWTPN